MDVTFFVAGSSYVVPEPQAAILAENLRIIARSDLAELTPSAAGLWGEGDWRTPAIELANSIEETLVHANRQPLSLDGGGAAAAYCVLRLMVGMESTPAAGLRDALGAPVVVDRRRSRAAKRAANEAQQLSRPELRELLLILFALALLTVVAGDTWSGLWYVLAPAIAGLLGARIATTRSTGKLAWSVASIVWWGVMLVPAALLVVLVGLFVLAVA